MAPWERAVALAQDDVCRMFPGADIAYYSLEAAQRALRLLLAAEGHPRAAAAVVTWEPRPQCAAAGRDGAAAAALGPGSLGFLGVAHQVGHLMHDVIAGRQQGRPAADVYVHGPAFIRYYAGAVAYLSPPAAAYLKGRHALRSAQRAAWRAAGIPLPAAQEPGLGF